MKILVACEYSGAVRDAFIRKGHDAMSCDLLPTDVPGPHYEGDVFDIINNGWDAMIAFPPCTFLTVAGARWVGDYRYPNREQDQRDALQFVLKLMNADIPRIAIENPIGRLSTWIRKPDQIVQPYWFGDMYQKSTCLWLKNLPKLVETNNVYEEMMKLPKKEREWIHNTPPGPLRSKLRSLTPPGLAEAMASQWLQST